MPSDNIHNIKGGESFEVSNTHQISSTLVIYPIESQPKPPVLETVSQDRFYNHNNQHIVISSGMAATLIHSQYCTSKTRQTMQQFFFQMSLHLLK